MLRDCIEALNINPNGIYVDCTAGGGGHSSEILRRLKDGNGSGKLISIDQDEAAINVCRQRFHDLGLEEYSVLARDNFTNLASVFERLGIQKVNGVLMDLGVSSYQLDNADRGFSYHSNSNSKLDMRMDTSASLSAYDVVNGYSESELRRIISDYGEENFASKIAWRIVTERETSPIETTSQLAEIIKKSIPQKSRGNENQHPARRTFQAIRIEVNSELDVIAPAIDAAVEHLEKEGRIAMITFHSLEDRIVKQKFVSLASGCTCPKDFPVCVCNNRPKIELISRKPILPDEEELKINPRSRSAKLRVAEKI